MTTRTIYNPETGADLGWPRADDGDVEGLQAPLVVLDVVEQDGPAVPEGFIADPVRNYDVENGRRIDTWELLAIPPDPEPQPEPQWQGFQIALLTDAQVHGMMLLAKDSYPGLISAWSTGLGQAATGLGFETFFTAWNLARALPLPGGEGALLPLDLVQHVAGLAAAADLPAEFIEGLNPPTPQGAGAPATLQS